MAKVKLLTLILMWPQWDQIWMQRKMHLLIRLRLWWTVIWSSPVTLQLRIWLVRCGVRHGVHLNVSVIGVWCYNGQRCHASDLHGVHQLEAFGVRVKPGAAFSWIAPVIVNWRNNDQVIVFIFVKLRARYELGAMYRCMINNYNISLIEAWVIANDNMWDGTIW